MVADRLHDAGPGRVHEEMLTDRNGPLRVKRSLEPGGAASCRGVCPSPAVPLLTR